MKYLGVPFISTRLSHSDCQPLLDKIMTRIQSWTSRSLSYAGRLQLISSVLYSIQMYIDAGASINTPNIGNSALIIEELDWGGQDALNTC